MFREENLFRNGEKKLINVRKIIVVEKCNKAYLLRNARKTRILSEVQANKVVQSSMKNILMM